MSVQSKLTAIADKLRQFFGTDDRYSLDRMAEQLGNEIEDLNATNEFIAAEFERLKEEYGEEASEFHPYETVAQLIEDAPWAVVNSEESFLAYYAMVEVIVNKILALNGNITPEGESEREIVAQEMDKAIEGMRNAYAAIAEKGGTVPAAQTMDGLDDAVRTLRAGVDAKTQSGTLTTTGANGTATVNCGFRPDLVAITGLMYSEGSEAYEYQLAFCFPLQSDSNAIPTAAAYTNTFQYGIDAEFTQLENGFTVMLTRYSSNGAGTGLQNYTFNYTAIKYTE